MRNIIIASISMLLATASFAQEEKKQSVTSKKQGQKKHEVKYIQRKTDLNPLTEGSKPLPKKFPEQKIVKVIGPKIKKKKSNLQKKSKMQPKGNFKAK
jgi:hypothetical protein